MKGKAIKRESVRLTKKLSKLTRWTHAALGDLSRKVNPKNEKGIATFKNDSCPGKRQDTSGRGVSVGKRKALSRTAG